MWGAFLWGQGFWAQGSAIVDRRRRILFGSSRMLRSHRRAVMLKG